MAFDLVNHTRPVGCIYGSATNPESLSGLARRGNALSRRTLRDGSLGDPFPGTSCQATIVKSLRDAAATPENVQTPEPRSGYTTSPSGFSPGNRRKIDSPCSCRGDRNRIFSSTELTSNGSSESTTRSHSLKIDARRLTHSLVQRTAIAIADPRSVSNSRSATRARGSPVPPAAEMISAVGVIKVRAKA